jgi:hypothetical protein
MNEIIAWLGRQSLFQTFEDRVECDVAEVRRMLMEANEQKEKAQDDE